MTDQFGTDEEAQYDADYVSRPGWRGEAARRAPARVTAPWTKNPPPRYNQAQINAHLRKVERHFKQEPHSNINRVRVDIDRTRLQSLVRTERQNRIQKALDEARSASDETRSEHLKTVVVPAIERAERHVQEMAEAFLEQRFKEKLATAQGSEKIFGARTGQGFLTPQDYQRAIGNAYSAVITQLSVGVNPGWMGVRPSPAPWQTQTAAARGMANQAYRVGSAFDVRTNPLRQFFPRHTKPLAPAPKFKTGVTGQAASRPSTSHFAVADPAGIDSIRGKHQQRKATQQIDWNRAQADMREAAALTDHARKMQGVTSEARSLSGQAAEQKVRSLGNRIIAIQNFLRTPGMSQGEAMTGFAQRRNAARRELEHSVALRDAIIANNRESLQRQQLERDRAYLAARHKVSTFDDAARLGKRGANLARQSLAWAHDLEAVGSGQDFWQVAQKNQTIQQAMRTLGLIYTGPKDISPDRQKAAVRELAYRRQRLFLDDGTHGDAFSYRLEPKHFAEAGVPLAEGERFHGTAKTAFAHSVGSTPGESKKARRAYAYQEAKRMLRVNPTPEQVAAVEQMLRYAMNVGSGFQPAVESVKSGKRSYESPQERNATQFSQISIASQLKTYMQLQASGAVDEFLPTGLQANPEIQQHRAQLEKLIAERAKLGRQGLHLEGGTIPGPNSAQGPIAANPLRRKGPLDPRAKALDSEIASTRQRLRTLEQADAAAMRTQEGAYAAWQINDKTAQGRRPGLSDREMAARVRQLQESGDLLVGLRYNPETRRLERDPQMTEQQAHHQQTVLASRIAMQAIQRHRRGENMRELFQLYGFTYDPSIEAEKQHTELAKQMTHRAQQIRGRIDSGKVNWDYVLDSAERLERSQRVLSERQYANTGNDRAHSAEDMNPIEDLQTVTNRWSGTDPRVDRHAMHGKQLGPRNLEFYSRTEREELAPIAEYLSSMPSRIIRITDPERRQAAEDQYLMQLAAFQRLADSGQSGYFLPQGEVHVAATLYGRGVEGSFYRPAFTEADDRTLSGLNSKYKAMQMAPVDKMNAVERRKHLQELSKVAQEIDNLNRAAEIQRDLDQFKVQTASFGRKDHGSNEEMMGRGTPAETVLARDPTNLRQGENWGVYEIWSAMQNNTRQYFPDVVHEMAEQTMGTSQGGAYAQFNPILGLLRADLRHDQARGQAPAFAPGGGSVPGFQYMEERIADISGGTMSPLAAMHGTQFLRILQGMSSEQGTPQYNRWHAEEQRALEAGDRVTADRIRARALGEIMSPYVTRLIGPGHDPELRQALYQSVNSRIFKDTRQLLSVSAMFGRDGRRVMEPSLPESRLGAMEQDYSPVDQGLLNASANVSAVFFPDVNLKRNQLAERAHPEEGSPMEMLVAMREALADKVGADFGSQEDLQAAVALWGEDNQAGGNTYYERYLRGVRGSRQGLYFNTSLTDTLFQWQNAMSGAGLTRGGGEKPALGLLRTGAFDPDENPEQILRLIRESQSASHSFRFMPLERAHEEGPLTGDLWATLQGFSGIEEMRASGHTQNGPPRPGYEARFEIATMMNAAYEALGGLSRGYKLPWSGNQTLPLSANFTNVDHLRSTNSARRANRDEWLIDAMAEFPGWGRRDPAKPENREAFVAHLREGWQKAGGASAVLSDTTPLEWMAYEDYMGAVGPLPLASGMLSGQGSSNAGPGFGMMGVETDAQAAEFEAFVTMGLADYHASQEGYAKSKDRGKTAFREETLRQFAKAMKIDEAAAWASGIVGNQAVAKATEMGVDTTENLFARARAFGLIDEDGTIAVTTPLFSSRAGQGSRARSLPTGSQPHDQLSTAFNTLTKGIDPRDFDLDEQGRIKIPTFADRSRPYTTGGIKTLAQAIYDPNDPTSIIGQMLRDDRAASKTGWPGQPSSIPGRLTEFTRNYVDTLPRSIKWNRTPGIVSKRKINGKMVSLPGQAGLRDYGDPGDLHRILISGPSGLHLEKGAREMLKGQLEQYLGQVDPARSKVLVGPGGGVNKWARDMAEAMGIPLEVIEGAASEGYSGTLKARRKMLAQLLPGRGRSELAVFLPESDFYVGTQGFAEGKRRPASGEAASYWNRAEKLHIRRRINPQAPSYQRGTGYHGGGDARLHAGEVVIDPATGRKRFINRDTYMAGLPRGARVLSTGELRGRAAAGGIKTRGLIPKDAYSFPEIPVEALDQNSKFLLGLFELVKGPLFRTQDDAHAMGVAPYKNLPGKHRRRKDLHHYDASKSYNQGQLDALSREWKHGTAPHVVIAPPGAGKSEIDLGVMLHELLGGKSMDSVPMFLGFANATVDQYKFKLMKMAEDGIIPYHPEDMRTFVDEGGASTIHKLASKLANQKIGANRLFGTTRVTDAYADDLGMFSEQGPAFRANIKSVMAANPHLLEEKAGRIQIREGSQFDAIQLASRSQLIETFREAMYEISQTPDYQSNTYGMAEMGALPTIDQTVIGRGGKITSTKSVRRGRAVAGRDTVEIGGQKVANISDRYRDRWSLEQGMSKQETEILERVTLLGQSGVDVRDLLDVLHPETGVKGFGDPDKWMAAVILDKMDEIWQRGALDWVPQADDDGTVHDKLGVVRRVADWDLIRHVNRFAEEMNEAAGDPTAFSKYIEMYGMRGIIGEAQDANIAQLLLARHVFGDDGALMLTGDPNQAISAFQGGIPSLMLAAAAAAQESGTFTNLMEQFRFSPEHVAQENEVWKALRGVHDDGSGPREVVLHEGMEGIGVGREKLGTNVAYRMAPVQEPGYNAGGARTPMDDRELQREAVAAAIALQVGADISHVKHPFKDQILSHAKRLTLGRSGLTDRQFMIPVGENVEVAKQLGSLQRWGVAAFAKFADNTYEEWESLSDAVGSVFANNDAGNAQLEALLKDPGRNIAEYLYEFDDVHGVDHGRQLIAAMLDPLGAAGRATKLGSVEPLPGESNPDDTGLRKVLREARQARRFLSMPSTNLYERTHDQGLKALIKQGAVVGTYWAVKGAEADYAYVPNFTERNMKFAEAASIAEAVDKNYLARVATTRGRQSVLIAPTGGSGKGRKGARSHAYFDATEAANRGGPIPTQWVGDRSLLEAHDAYAYARGRALSAPAAGAIADLAYDPGYGYADTGISPSSYTATMHADAARARKKLTSSLAARFASHADLDVGQALAARQWKMFSGEAYAEGGPVTGSENILVAEKGPELLVLGERHGPNANKVIEVTKPSFIGMHEGDMVLNAAQARQHGVDLRLAVHGRSHKGSAAAGGRWDQFKGGAFDIARPQLANQQAMAFSDPTTARMVADALRYTVGAHTKFDPTDSGQMVVGYDNRVKAEMGAALLKNVILPEVSAQLKDMTPEDARRLLGSDAQRQWGGKTASGRSYTGSDDKLWAVGQQLTTFADRLGGAVTSVRAFNDSLRKISSGLSQNFQAEHGKGWTESMANRMANVEKAVGILPQGAIGSMWHGQRELAGKVGGPVPIIDRHGLIQPLVDPKTGNPAIGPGGHPVARLALGSDEAMAELLTRARGKGGFGFSEEAAITAMVPEGIEGLTAFNYQGATGQQMRSGKFYQAPTDPQPGMVFGTRGFAQGPEIQPGNVLGPMAPVVPAPPPFSEGIMGRNQVDASAAPAAAGGAGQGGRGGGRRGGGSTGAPGGRQVSFSGPPGQQHEGHVPGGISGWANSMVLSNQFWVAQNLFMQQQQLSEEARMVNQDTTRSAAIYGAFSGQLSGSADPGMAAYNVRTRNEQVFNENRAGMVGVGMDQAAFNRASTEAIRAGLIAPGEDISAGVDTVLDTAVTAEALGVEFSRLTGLSGRAADRAGLDKIEDRRALDAQIQTIAFNATRTSPLTGEQVFTAMERLGPEYASKMSGKDAAERMRNSMNFFGGLAAQGMQLYEQQHLANQLDNIRRGEGSIPQTVMAARAMGLLTGGDSGQRMDFGEIHAASRSPQLAQTVLGRMQREANIVGMEHSNAISEMKLSGVTPMTPQGITYQSAGVTFTGTTAIQAQSLDIQAREIDFKQAHLMDEAGYQQSELAGQQKLLDYSKLAHERSGEVLFGTPGILASQGRELEIQGRALGVQREIHEAMPIRHGMIRELNDIQAARNNLAGEALGMQKQLQMYNREQLGIAQQRYEIDGKILELDKARHGIEGQRIEIQKDLNDITRRDAPLQKADAALEASLLPIHQQQYALQSELVALSGQAIQIEGQALGAHEKTLGIQGTLLDMADQALAIQGQQIAQSGVTLGLQTQMLPLQATQLGLQEQAFHSGVAAQQAGFAVSRASLAESARSTQVQLGMMPLRSEIMQTQHTMQLNELQRTQQSLSTSRWYEDMMFGRPGADQSYDAYARASFAQGRARAGQSSLTSGLVDSPDPNSGVGLQQQMTYRSLQHQAAQLMYGQSSLSSAQAYNETMDYLEFQKNFAEIEAEARAKVTEQQRRFQDESLKEQQELIKLTQELETKQLEEQQRSLEAQMGLIGLQEAALAAQEQAAADANAAQAQGFEIARLNLDIQASQLEEAKLAHEAAIQSHQMALVGQELQRAQYEEAKIAHEAAKVAHEQNKVNQEMAISKLQEMAINLEREAIAVERTALAVEAIDKRLADMDLAEQDADLAHEQGGLRLEDADLGRLNQLFEILKMMTSLDLGDINLEDQQLVMDAAEIQERMAAFDEWLTDRTHALEGIQLEGAEARQETSLLELAQAWDKWSADLAAWLADGAKLELQQTELTNAVDRLNTYFEQLKLVADRLNVDALQTDLERGLLPEQQAAYEDAVAYDKEILRGTKEYDQALRAYEEGKGPIDPALAKDLGITGVNEEGYIGIQDLVDQLTSKYGSEQLEAMGLPGTAAELKQALWEDPQGVQAALRQAVTSRRGGMAEEFAFRQAENDKALDRAREQDAWRDQYGWNPQEKGQDFRNRFEDWWDAAGLGSGIGYGSEGFFNTMVGGSLLLGSGPVRAIGRGLMKPLAGPAGMLMGGLKGAIPGIFGAARGSSPFSPGNFAANPAVMSKLPMNLLKGMGIGTAFGVGDMVADQMGWGIGESDVLSNVGMGVGFGSMFGLPGMAIGGALGLGLTAYQQRDQLGELINSSTGLSGDVLGGLPAQLGKLVTGDLSVFGDFFDQLGQLAGNIPNVPGDIWSAVQSGLAEMQGWFDQLGTAIRDFQSNFDAIGEFLRSVTLDWGIVEEGVGHFFSFLGSFRDAVAAWLEENGAIEAIGNFFSWLGSLQENIQGWLEENVIIETIGNFFGWLGSLGENIVGWLEENVVIETIGNFFGWLGSLGENVVSWLEENTVIETVGNFFGWLGSLGENILGWLEENIVIETIGNFFGWLGSLGENILSWLEENTVIETVGNFFGWLGNFATDVGGWVVDQGQAALDGIQRFFDFLGQFPTWAEEQLRKIPGYEALFGGETLPESPSTALHEDEGLVTNSHLGVSESLGVPVPAGVKPVDASEIPAGMGGVGYAGSESQLMQEYYAALEAERQRLALEEQARYHPSSISQQDRYALTIEQMARQAEIQRQYEEQQSLQDQAEIQVVYDQMMLAKGVLGGQLAETPQEPTAAPTSTTNLTTTDSILREIYYAIQESNGILRTIAAGAGIASGALPATSIPEGGYPGAGTPSLPSTSLSSLGSDIAGRVSGALGLPTGTSGSGLPVTGSLSPVPTAPTPSSSGMVPTSFGPGPVSAPASPSAAPVSSVPVTGSAPVSGSAAPAPALPGSDFLMGLLPKISAEATALLTSRNPSAAALMRGDLSMTNPHAAGLLAGDFSYNPQIAQLLPIAMQQAPWLADMLPSFLTAGMTGTASTPGLMTTGGVPSTVPTDEELEAMGLPPGRKGRKLYEKLSGKGSGLRAKGEAIRSKLMGKAAAIREKFGMPSGGGVARSGGGGGIDLDLDLKAIANAALMPKEMSEEEFLKIVAESAPAGKLYQHLLQAYDYMNVDPPVDILEKAGLEAQGLLPGVPRKDSVSRVSFPAGFPFDEGQMPGVLAPTGTTGAPAVTTTTTPGRTVTTPGRTITEPGGTTTTSAPIHDQAMVEAMLAELVTGAGNGLAGMDSLVLGTSYPGTQEIISFPDASYPASLPKSGSAAAAEIADARPRSTSGITDQRDSSWAELVTGVGISNDPHIAMLPKADPSQPNNIRVGAEAALPIVTLTDPPPMTLGELARGVTPPEASLGPGLVMSPAAEESMTVRVTDPAANPGAPIVGEKILSESTGTSAPVDATVPPSGTWEPLVSPAEYAPDPNGPLQGLDPIFGGIGYVSQGFGPEETFAAQSLYMNEYNRQTGVYGAHEAYDIGTGYNIHAPLYTPWDGKVVSVDTMIPADLYYGVEPGQGYTDTSVSGDLYNVGTDGKKGEVAIQRPNGDVIIYGHIDDSLGLKVGDTVSQGEMVALSGSSGQAPGGVGMAHTHFAALKYTGPYNPDGTPKYTFEEDFWTDVNADGSGYWQAVRPTELLTPEEMEALAASLGMIGDPATAPTNTSPSGQPLGKVDSEYNVGSPTGTIPYSQSEEIGIYGAGGDWSNVNQWDATIEAEAQKWSEQTGEYIDPALMKAIMTIESGGYMYVNNDPNQGYLRNPHSTSFGLYQIQPQFHEAKARDLGYDISTPEGQIGYMAALLAGEGNDSGGSTPRERYELSYRGTPAGGSDYLVAEDKKNVDMLLGEIKAAEGSGGAAGSEPWVYEPGMYQDKWVTTPGSYEETPGYYKTTTEYVETLPEYDPDAAIQSFPSEPATASDYSSSTQYVDQAATGHYEPVYEERQVWVEDAAAPTGYYETRSVFVEDGTGPDGKPYGHYEDQQVWVEEPAEGPSGHYETQQVQVGEQWVEDTPATTVPVTTTEYVPGTSTYIPGETYQISGGAGYGGGATGGQVTGYTPSGEPIITALPSFSQQPGMPGGFGSSGSTIPAGAQVDQMSSIWGNFAGTPAGDIALGVLGGTYNSSGMSRPSMPSSRPMVPYGTNGGMIDAELAIIPFTWPGQDEALRTITEPGAEPVITALPSGRSDDPVWTGSAPWPKMAPGPLPGGLYPTSDSIPAGLGGTDVYGLQNQGQFEQIPGTGSAGGSTPSQDAYLLEVASAIRTQETGGQDLTGQIAYLRGDELALNSGIFKTTAEAYGLDFNQIVNDQAYADQAISTLLADYADDDASKWGGPSGMTVWDWGEQNLDGGGAEAVGRVYFGGEVNGTFVDEQGRSGALYGDQLMEKLGGGQVGQPMPMAPEMTTTGEAVPMDVPVEPVPTTKDGVKPLPGTGIPLDVPVEPGMGLSGGITGMGTSLGIPSATDLVNQISASMGLSGTGGGKLLPGAIVPVGTFDGNTQMPNQGVPLIVSDPMGSRYTGTPEGLWGIPGNKRHMLDPDSPIRMGANLALRNNGGGVISQDGEWVAGLSPAEQDAMYGTNWSGKNRMVAPGKADITKLGQQFGAALGNLNQRLQQSGDMMTGMDRGGRGAVPVKLEKGSRVAVEGDELQRIHKGLGDVGERITKGSQLQARGLAGLRDLRVEMPRIQMPELRIPQMRVPRVPGHASGTRAGEAGLALVGEAGPELVDFRGGERVYNHGELRQMLRENRDIAKQGAEGMRQFRREQDVKTGQGTSISPQLDAKMSRNQKGTGHQVNVNLTFNGARAVDEKTVQKMLDKTIAEIEANLDS